jgi:hypothetical protein
MKTLPSEVPVANEELYVITSRMTKANKGTVEDIIRFTGNFIADTIRSGQMQGVQIPYFGKFRPKVERVYANQQRKAMNANGADLIAKAIAGKPINENEQDETV